MSLEMFKDRKLYYGGLASMMAASCTHPLDTLKVRLQTNTVKGATVFSITSGIIKNEGVQGLYKGLSASLFRQATYSLVRFAAFDILRAHFQPPGTKPTVLGTIGVAAVSGAFGAIAGNPGDISNVRMQDDGRKPVELRRGYRNVFHALSKISREEGMLALWGGAGPNIARGMLVTVGQLASYDRIKAFLLTQTNGMFKDDLLTHFTGSCIAGFIASFISQPVDVVKTRVMNSKGETALGIVRTTLTKEGPAAFFKGFVPAFVRLGPHTVLTFIFLEQLKKRL